MRNAIFDHVGTFSIPEAIMREQPEAVMYFMSQVLIFEASYDYLTKHFFYHAYSQYFNPCPPIEPDGITYAIPHYIITFIITHDCGADYLIHFVGDNAITVIHYTNPEDRAPGKRKLVMNGGAS